MDAAKGESCTLNIPGHCIAGTGTTVFCHHNDGGGGSSKLTGPLTGGFGCAGCHDVIDNRVVSTWTADDKEFFKRRSMIRTLNRLIEKGYVTVAGLKT